MSNQRQSSGSDSRAAYSSASTPLLGRPIFHVLLFFAISNLGGVNRQNWGSKCGGSQQMKKWDMRLVEKEFASAPYNQRRERGGR